MGDCDMKNPQLAYQIKLLTRDEGLRLKPYRCTAGKLTIGVGRNLEDVGITKEEAEQMLANDISRVVVDIVKRIPWAMKLDDARFSVIHSMVFQMGIGGVMNFRKFLNALQMGDFVKASIEMMDSKWAQHDSPARAKRLAEVMRSGKLETL
jgi:lysozyme